MHSARSTGENVHKSSRILNMVVGYIGMHGILKVLLRNLQHFVSAQHGVFRRQADAGRYPKKVVITAAKTMFQVRPIV